MANKPMALMTLVGMVCICGAVFAGCGKDQKENRPVNVFPTLVPGQASVREYIPSVENVKLLGRTYLLGKTLWLSYSASGIEFTFTGTKADITLLGDNMAIGLEDIHYCRVGIYVNDELVYDDRLTEFEKTVTAFESDTEQTVTIKVLKLSEVTDSTMGISKITVTSQEPIKPGPAKAHTIEFIGDSITCGFGVDATDENEQYTTATEDATKAYAYKTANELKADYSLVSISGYGIISGYTGNGVINPYQVIPTYYENMGFSYGFFNRTIRVPSIEWDFSSFVPELIVINLGTNDSSYCGNDKEKQNAFTEGYVAFIKQVRAKNPDAVILCTLGMMGDTLFPCVEEAVKSYSEETGDQKIHSMKFDVQQSADGYGACWHPSETTHNKASLKLAEEIRSLLGW